MADKKPQAEDKNKFKPGFEVQFIAENIFVASIGNSVKRNAEGKLILPTDQEVCEIVEMSIAAAKIFQENKKHYGIRDRFTDDLEKLD